MKQLEFNQQFQEALYLLEQTNQTLFITGRAGTGKSTLLTYFRKHTKKDIVVLAPTGVAALNVQGETIHSFFKFKPAVTPESALRSASRCKKKLYKKIKTIVIDEISMVRADLLDCVDIFLRAIFQVPEPFGGVQMIFIGDLYQLPPVVTTQERDAFRYLYDSPYFFSADVMQNEAIQLQFLELKKIYRQTEETFISLLNAVRNNSITQDQIAQLNGKVDPNCQDNDNGYIYLTTTNNGADIINRDKLTYIDGPSSVFQAEVSGEFLPKMAPTDMTLCLKVGAQVMFLNNDVMGRWVNGTIGEIAGIESDHLVVQTQMGDIVRVAPYKWNLYKYFLNAEKNALEQESVGEFTQYPIKLAWAVTIHKSQGKTFDKVIIDIGSGTFAHGQLYVALSRCSAFQGLVLKKPLSKRHVIMDWRVVKYLAQFQDDKVLSAS